MEEKQAENAPELTETLDLDTIESMDAEHAHAAARYAAQKVAEAFPLVSLAFVRALQTGKTAPLASKATDLAAAAMLWGRAMARFAAVTQPAPEVPDAK